MSHLPSPSKNNRELSDEVTHQATIEHLRDHLPLAVNGTKASTEMVLDVLVHAAVKGQSIEASCAELAGSADSNTLRDYVNEAFGEEMLEDVEKRVNEALVSRLPKKVKKKSQEIVIDIHDQAFYGQSSRLLKYASRGQAKAGTTYFYRIATAYLIVQGMRITLGVIFVHSGMSLAQCVIQLIKLVKAQTIKPGCLFLDRGFASIEVYRCLQRRRIPALIACPIRGKDKGTKALCKGRQSYTTFHTFSSQSQGTFTSTVAVVRSYTHTSQRGQPKQRKAAWFLYVLIHLTLSPQAVHARYRYRFGIEASYRQMRQVRARTTSRNPVLRFLFMALGFILLNFWLALRFRFCQRPSRGRAGHSLDNALFRLTRFAAFLSQAIQRVYGSVVAITALVLPLQTKKTTKCQNQPRQSAA
jgi:Transposase DDE domain